MLAEILAEPSRYSGGFPAFRCRKRDLSVSRDVSAAVTVVVDPGPLVRRFPRGGRTASRRGIVAGGGWIGVGWGLSVVIGDECVLGEGVVKKL